MRITTKKHNAVGWVKKQKGDAELISEIKTPLCPQLNEIPLTENRPKNFPGNFAGTEAAEKYGLDIDPKQKRRYSQRQWRLLKKLNGRFRKKVRKQQQLKADISKLQKQILDVKQEIINLHK